MAAEKSKPYNGDYELFTVAVKQSQHERLLQTLKRINKFACNKRDVPYPLILTLHELLEDGSDVEVSEAQKEVKALIKKVRLYFSQRKEYHIIGDVETFENAPFNSPAEMLLSYRKYSFDEMCRVLLQQFHGEVSKDKGATLRAIYKRIDDYTKQFSKADLHSFTFYKKVVVATFISNILGYIHPPLPLTQTPANFYRQGNEHIKKRPPKNLL